MPKYDDCPEEVGQLAVEVMRKFERHAEIIESGLKIAYFFAMPDTDQYGRPTGAAISHNGYPASALAKKLNLLDRLATGSDYRILIDRDHWDKIGRLERMALLDHELYHFIIQQGKRDDLGRPCVVIRKHDFQVGWFKCIAQSWGEASPERIQSKLIMDAAGQYFWPDLAPAAPPVS